MSTLMPMSIPSWRSLRPMNLLSLCFTPKLVPKYSQVIHALQVIVLLFVKLDIWILTNILMENKVQIVWYPFFSSVGNRTSGLTFAAYLKQIKGMILKVHDLLWLSICQHGSSMHHPHLEISEIVGQSSHSKSVIF